MIDPIINLTEAATNHIKEMLEKDPKGIGFRLGIKKTGCSGYAYVPKIVDLESSSDIHFVADGLHIYVDPVCEQFIKGLTIDYVCDESTDNNVGLKQKRMVFINPNEANRCGCGESFTIEE